jgi:hypothetical protein
MGLFDEFNSRFSGRFFGKYRGYVTRVDDDPKNMGRLMVKVPAVLGTNDELGWALPSPAVGGSRNVGLVSLPFKGDFVWVEFEEGDPERPIWSAGPWPLSNGESFMPKHAQGKGDATDYAMRDFGNIPPSQFAGSYGKVFTLQAHDGSFLELDGSDAHRVQLSHYTGTRIEFTQDGSLQEAVVGMARKRTTSDLNVEVGGSHLFTVCGNETKKVNGFVQETYVKGVSRLYGFRLNQTPGLDEASMTPDDRAKLYSNGVAVYLPSDLKEKGNSYTGIWDNSVSYTCGQYVVRAIGNLNLTSGGKFSAMSMSAINLTASESMELVGMNTMYGDVGLSAATPAKAFTAYGYNGTCELVSFDISALAGCAGVVADHGMSSAINNPTVLSRSLPSTTIFANAGPINTVSAGSTGGAITLVGKPLANVLLGGDTLAVMSVPITETLLELLIKPLMNLLFGHTHTTPVGESGPSALLASGLPALQAMQAATVSSTKVKIAL